MLNGKQLRKNATVVSHRQLKVDSVQYLLVRITSVTIGMRMTDTILMICKTLPSSLAPMSSTVPLSALTELANLCRDPPAPEEKE